MMPRIARIAALTSVFLVLATASFGQVRLDFEQKYFSEAPEPVLDHSMVKKDGVFHLYYLRGNPAVDIGHATTEDLVHWTVEDPILAPGTWDNRALWAPRVFQPGTGYYMYYTGVNWSWSQQSGLAYSNDLESWIKIPWPVYHPDESWALWTEDTWSHGRDPHVFEHDGTYYMMITAKTLTDKGAVACATSQDLIQWTDVGPIYVHDSWHVLESVYITHRNGLFHMFFTEEAIFGTSHMSSDSLFSGWDIGTRILVDNGHAGELTELPGVDIFSRHSVYSGVDQVETYYVRFDTLRWIAHFGAPVRPWPLAADWEIIQGDAFTYQPVFQNNLAARGEDVDVGFKGDSWIGTNERYTGPLGNGSIGGQQGDAKTGILRSRTFEIVGNSMSLLVGGADDPERCYVALVSANSGEHIYSETGKNVEEMDERLWDLRPHIGRMAYIEIADLSGDVFGHINCDEIVESGTIITAFAPGNGNKKIRPGRLNTHTLAPRTAMLHQNHPNPFNPQTSIQYEVPGPGRIVIEIFDARGRSTRTLVDEVKPPGLFEAVWDGTDDGLRPVGSGVYFYRMSFSGEVVQTRKMLLLK